MIGRRHTRKSAAEDDKPRGFDDFELRLGDVMRGERATMGKSLLDVQRELRIKADYIAAIENCDPDTFDTPGFIAGYVRSYARYLNIDPDKAFDTFCAESGFQVAHGMAAEASVVHKPSRRERISNKQNDMFVAPSTPFVPAGEALMSRIEPGAIGSMVVLLTLISAIGYGGWTVLKEVQRVQVAPVEQTPVVLSEIDPLAAVRPVAGQQGLAQVAGASPQIATPRQSAALDRLYRPQALDVPVLTSRDAPIATLDPNQFGAFTAPEEPEPVDIAATIAEQVGLSLASLSDDKTAPADADEALPVPQVVEDLGPTIRMIATEAAWVRIRSAEGNTLFESTMQAGETYDIPVLEVPPTLRAGNAGAVYFAMGTDCYGPIGDPGKIVSNVAMERGSLTTALSMVDKEDGTNPLNLMVASWDEAVRPLPKLPCTIN